MKYATFAPPGSAAPRLGVVRSDRIISLADLAGEQAAGTFPASLLELIQAGPEIWQRAAAVAGAAAGSAAAPGMEFPLGSVRLYAPIPRPVKNVFCLGLNYIPHMEESARARGREAKIPEVPVFFTKAPTAVNGPYDPIPWDPAVTSQVDYEGELGVVIGAAGRDIPRERALQHIFGYTVINDFSARDLQLRHLQWFKGKSLDGFCPMGPWLVTAEEFGDPQNKQVATRVNGETRQSASTAGMIFPVAAIIEFLSQGMTLEPGDIISTGTPEGVGMGRTPPQYLHDGDVVETEVEGIGVLRNRIQAAR